MIILRHKKSILFKRLETMWTRRMKTFLGRAYCVNVNYMTTIGSRRMKSVFERLYYFATKLQQKQVTTIFGCKLGTVFCTQTLNKYLL
jgi:hypothetical protein